MIPLALVGFIVGILSSISGLGGGFMIVPLLIFLGREAKLAVGTSFVFILVVAISSIISPVSYTHLTLPTNRIV